MFLFLKQKSFIGCWNSHVIQAQPWWILHGDLPRTSCNSGVNITRQMFQPSVVAFCQNRLANNGATNFSPWTIEDHVRGCGELEKECKRCRAAVKRRNRSIHDDCLMADIQYESGVLLKRADEDEHRRNMCALQEIICPLKCGETFKRCVLLLHYALKKIWAWLCWRHFWKAHLHYQFCSIIMILSMYFLVKHAAFLCDIT